MRKRNMAAIAILILATCASLYCYSRLAYLLPLQNESMVTKTNAHISDVTTPMVKKSGSTSDVVSDVRFRFEVEGRVHEGMYSIRGRDKAPKKGAVEPVVYYTQNPVIFLRAEEYADLPRQILAMQVLMAVFALIALIVPFAVMHHRAA